MTTILCNNCALIKRFFNRIQSSQLQFWIRYPSLLSGSAINWARLRFQKTNFDFRIITSRFSCVSFLSVNIFNFWGFFSSLYWPSTTLWLDHMFRHAKAFRAMRDICMQHLAALRWCYAIQQERKREDSQSSHLPPKFNETWSPLIPEQEEMIDLLQTMIQFTSDHWVTLLIGFLIFLSYRYVTRLHCLHYVRPIRHLVKLHIIRWSNTFLLDIGTRK